MVTDTPHSFCRVLAWISGERMGEVVMAEMVMAEMEGKKDG